MCVCVCTCACVCVCVCVCVCACCVTTDNILMYISCNFNRMLEQHDSLSSSAEGAVTPAVDQTTPVPSSQSAESDAKRFVTIY